MAQGQFNPSFTSIGVEKVSFTFSNPTQKELEFGDFKASIMSCNKAISLLKYTSDPAAVEQAVAICVAYKLALVFPYFSIYRLPEGTGI